MARTYRKPELKQTYSSTSDNKEFVRAEQVRRDKDDVKDIGIGLEDIDEAFKFFLTDIIKPYIIKGGERIKVPVLYANADKWVSIQKNGYLRDEKNRLMLPLIVFRRNSIEERADLKRLEVKKFDNDARYTFSTQYNKYNSYSKFSKLNNIKPVKEFYTVTIPDYVRIPYDVIIWTQYNDQVNKIIEQIIFHEGSAYGAKYKFTIKSDDFSFESVNETGQDKMVKCTATLHANAYIVPENVGFISNMKKSFSAQRIVLTESVVDDINNIPASTSTVKKSYVSSEKINEKNRIN